jgi:hypothetical protein
MRARHLGAPKNCCPAVLGETFDLLEVFALMEKPGGGIWEGNGRLRNP